MRVRGGGSLFALVIGVLACGLLIAPAGAAAATVVNGDFESGTLDGWQVRKVTDNGNWFAYKGTSDPIAKVRGPQKFPPPLPPQGKFAAISEQVQRETLVLSQDISLAPGESHRLGLLAYYESASPLASPETLSVDDEVLAGQANQQFRIDVLRAGAPIESLAPADILATAFRTTPDSPQSMGATWVTADLSPFAGQTVTLRVANAAHEELLFGAVDAVAVDSAKPGEKLPPLGSSGFGFGKLKLNRAKGTATLAVDVPGPGQLTATGKTIKRAGTTAAKAGVVTLRLQPNSAGRAVLARKHKLKVRVAVTFAPAGGEARTASRSVTLRLAAPRHQR